MDLTNPIAVYTAEGNIEAHSVAEWLISNGIDAYPVEDNSGLSLYAFGTISQFHKPQVFVDRSNAEKAAELLRQFETKKRARQQALDAAPPISSECEECGETSDFPASQDGTVQNCPRCHSFMDVGTLDWPYDTDFGEAGTES